MTTRTNTFSGANGTAITTANSAAGGTAFDDVVMTGPASATYDSSVKAGNVVAKIVTSSDWNDDAVLVWDMPAADRCAGRFELRLHERASQENDQYWIWLLTITIDYAIIQFYVNEDGKLRANSSRGMSYFFNTAIPLDTWVRIEFDFITVGAERDSTISYFADTETETPTETFGGQDPCGGEDLPASTVRIGQPNNAGYNSAVTLWLDNLTVNDTGMPGPWSDGSIPPAVVEVIAPLPTIPETIPPAFVDVFTPLPELIVATTTLISPVSGQHVPSLRPVFEVVVTTEQTDLLVEVEYADNEEFTDAVSLTAALPDNVVPARAVVRPEEPIADGAWWWRARVFRPEEVGDWTAPIGFIVSTEDGDAMIGGLWNVVVDQAPNPHLWYVSPPRGQAGDTCYAVGTGFGPTSATVSIAGIQATDVHLAQVAATGDAYTAERVIDPQTNTADARHQTVSFVVPEVPQPGGILIVDGS